MNVVDARAPSRFSLWLALEARSDRYVSYGALALGLGALVVVLLA